MHPKNTQHLADRVTKAAEATLSAQSYVRPIDLLVGLGWLDPNAEARWRRRQVDYLERIVQANLSQLSEAMKLFRQWATSKGLKPSETQYVAKVPGRPSLRFSKSGAESIERQYRTNWVSPALSEKAREKLAEMVSRPPDLVVIQPLHQDWVCHRCKTGGGWLLVMENEGPACMNCVGMGDLVFLPSGDAALTRRAKAKSPRSAVVVRFSRSRKRYERQGLLVEAQGLAEARAELGLPPMEFDEDV